MAVTLTLGKLEDNKICHWEEDVGTAAHEMGHALGFFHSQSRVDRDSAISIIVANIQFDKESATTNYNYGMPYDYGSIMQYGATR
ncbi:astacin [Cooperia oncophora]